MPNALLSIDYNSPAFASAHSGEHIDTVLAAVFLGGLTYAVTRVTGMPASEVELETRAYGYRIVGEGGTLLPVNLYVRALRRQRWMGKYKLDNGKVVSKPEAVVIIATEQIALMLTKTPFAALPFDMKLENARGDYGTGEEARQRLRERDLID